MAGLDRARGLFLLRLSALLLVVGFVHMSTWPSGNGLGVFCAQLAVLVAELVLGGLGGHLYWRMYLYESGQTKKQHALLRLVTKVSQRFDVRPPRT
jgi:hypothetical protein